MSSSDTSIINVNFIGQGIKGVKELRGRALQLLNKSSNSTDLPNAQGILNRSHESNPEIYFVKPTPPTQQRPNTTRPRTQRTIEPDYKTIFLDSDRKLQINSVNCGFKVVDAKFYKVQISESADPLINEVVFSMELKQAMGTDKPQIFPVYYDHFTLSGADLLNAENKLLINIKLYDMQRQFIDLNAKLNREGNNNLIVKNMERIKNKITTYEMILNSKTFKCLVTEALSEPSSLENKINKINNAISNRYYGISKIIEDINTLMENYKYYGETLGFIHSDLHMNNIQVDQGNNYKIIDFGRCFMFDEDTLKQKYINETNLD